MKDDKPYIYYLYNLAWSLDLDTHKYFRVFLNTFFNRRKILGELREFLNGAFAMWLINERMQHKLNSDHMFNSSRTSIHINPYRLCLRPTAWLDQIYRDTIWLALGPSNGTVVQRRGPLLVPNCLRTARLVIIPIDKIIWYIPLD